MQRLIRAGLIALIFAGITYGSAEVWIRTTILPAVTPETSVTVLDRNGTLLRAYAVADGRWRLPVSLPDVDKRYIELLLNFEDKRFYNHNGVDVLSFGRAILQAAVNGRIISGGSTLTMQVARLLEEGKTGSYSGKLRQIRLALALERQLTKPEILTIYLHLAPFGGNIEGVRAASLTYFGKEPGRLTPAQAALLVALPQSPERRRPDRHVAAAEVARNRVLQRAKINDLLPSDEVTAALQETVPDARIPFPILAPHLADRLLEHAPSRSIHNTTLDKDLQIALETMVRNHAEAGGKYLSAALIVADHETGEILARVGSPDMFDTTRRGFVDMTMAVRSPGSTLKPLIYGLAFENGIAHPETLVEDRPTSFNGYAPQNFDKQFHGTMTARRALQLSLNIPAVALLDSVGPAQLLARLRRAGANPILPKGRMIGLAIGLGGVGLTLEGLVTTYAAIARGGQPIHLSSTKSRENILLQPVLSPNAAWQVGDILIGTPPPLYGPTHQIAYKTGTSYGYRDAWAIGFDGQHVIGVWMGRADATPMPGVLGVDVAAPMLFEAFSRLKPTPMALRPPPPSVLTVSNLELPLPLRHFQHGDPLDNPNRPEITFPPDGARLDTGGDTQNTPMVIKLRNGRLPITVLIDGTPIQLLPWEREVQWQPTGRGFVSISVIDAIGETDHVQVFLD